MNFQHFLRFFRWFRQLFLDFSLWGSNVLNFLEIWGWAVLNLLLILAKFEAHCSHKIVLMNKTRTRKCYNIFSHLFLFWRFCNQYHSLSQKNQVQNFAPAGDRTRDLRAWLRNQSSDVTRTRSAFSTGSYWPILLIFNTKQWKSYVLLVLKFEKNRTKIDCDRESAATRKCKIAAMTSSNSKF